MTIISLTTIPSRFDKIGPTLETLVAQNGDISGVRLYIPQRYKRFPEYDGRLPSVPAGVEIMRCEQDYGPATKILPAARMLRGSGQRVLFCDDDRLYEPGWAANLIEAGERRPKSTVCVIGWHLEKWLTPAFSSTLQPAARHRPGWADLGYRYQRLKQQVSARQLKPVRFKPPRKPIASSGWVHVFGGYGGVLVDPAWIPDWAFHIPDDFWLVDDIWLSGCLACQGIGIWAEQNLSLAPATEADRTDALFRSQFNGRDRLALNQSCISYMRENYRIWC